MFISLFMAELIYKPSKAKELMFAKYVRDSASPQKTLEAWVSGVEGIADLKIPKEDIQKKIEENVAAMQAAHDEKYKEHEAEEKEEPEAAEASEESEEPEEPEASGSLKDKAKKAAQQAAHSVKKAAHEAKKGAEKLKHETSKKASEAKMHMDKKSQEAALASIERDINEFQDRANKSAAAIVKGITEKSSKGAYKNPQFFQSLALRFVELKKMEDQDEFVTRIEETLKDVLSSVRKNLKKIYTDEAEMEKVYEEIIAPINPKEQKERWINAKLYKAFEPEKDKNGEWEAVAQKTFVSRYEEGNEATKIELPSGD